VLTLLQDLQVLEYLDFHQHADEMSGRKVITEVSLTAKGLGLVVRRKSNDDVLLD
jgi:hypothetical protein